MNATLPLALHNPALLPAETLLAEFTARRNLLDLLLGIVRQNKPGQPPQHALLIGPRGMGKTTMLWAVAHTVARDADLARQWQPVVFDEESRRVGDLADFWLEALRQWEHATGSSANQPGKLLDSAGDGSNFEEGAQRAFLEAVSQSGRRALLLVDNFNDLLASVHDPEPLHRLRAFLMEDARVTIIGTATRYFKEITDIDRPFFDFFRVIELHPLSLEETRDCLLALADSRKDELVPRALEEHAGTVQALHLFTGGNPRLIKTSYRLIAEGLRGGIRADLERLLDEFTPYFKAILDALPGQQQRIVDAMALAWDPVEVAEIAHATRLPSNQVSAQLRALVKAGLVVEAAGQPKRKSYLLADRFFNIQYLMRHGRAARNRFDWFVAIVRLIFPDHAQTLAKTAREAAGCGSEGLRDARDLMRGALLRAGSDEARRQLLAATLRETWDNETVATLSEWLDLESAKRLLPEVEIVDFFCRMPHALRVELGYEPLRATWWFALTDVLEEKESWAMAEAAYHKAIELDPKYGRAWTFLGNLLKLKLGRHAEAESAYRKAIQIGSKDPYPWICLGYLLSEQDGRYKEAEVALRNSIQLNSNDPYPWFCLGRLLSSDRFGRYDEAEAAFRKAIELDPKDAAVWTCLGNVLRFHLCRDADAERAYRTASELNPKDEYPWIGLGSLLSSQPTGRYPEAKAAFLNAIELNPDRSYPWAALADILNTKSNRTDEPRSYAMKALRIEPDSEYSRIVFLRLCGENGEDWRAVLPGLAAFCGANPKSEEVFEFTVDGFLRLARLSTPGEALAMIAALPDPAPFETLADAFRAYANVDHLQRLAPERRTLAMELLKRLPARK